ncbi:MAG: 50S ribosomal protein L14 [bacterium]|nr:50S ribosomal protein L14 [bacterium]
MIQEQTRLKVADNTGAKTIKCIKVLGGSHRRFGRIGDLIVAAVQEAAPHGTVQEHAKVYAVVARQRKEFRRSDGSYIRFDDNAAVILQSRESFDPMGTRIFGPIPRELKERGFNKIISLAKEVL